jgi:hypothetical protein
LLRAVRGELDWIVMKCLEKDRNRRYETANALARDIDCYLADEPVQACPPSVAYRFRKFVRRNKGVLSIAGLVLIFLLLLCGGSGWVIRDRSARRAEVAQQASESLKRARAWLGEDKLALARQELAEPMTPRRGCGSNWLCPKRTAGRGQHLRRCVPLAGVQPMPFPSASRPCPATRSWNGTIGRLRWNRPSDTRHWCSRSGAPSMRNSSG